jgi:two-component system OmpR family response regulator/two-component system response regulator CpxR
MASHILLVDDDVELAALLKDYLETEGFRVQVLHDGEAAVAEALSGRHALMVLDVMMLGINGIEVLRRVRAESALPVLMLTGRGDDADRVIGLELGADDYVPKPCTPRELTARVRAILRRTGAELSEAAATAPLQVGELTLWPQARRAEWARQALNLTSTEFSLLEVLARHAGSPVSKADLSQQALDRPLTRFDRSIDVHVSSIRQKLGRLPDGRSCIDTVYRKGYQLLKA